MPPLQANTGQTGGSAGRPAEPTVAVADSRRAFPRIPCRVLVDYVVDGRAYRDCIANISEGGAFIETSHPLEDGSPVTLAFSLFQDQQPIKIVGEVAWTGPTGVGVRFRHNAAIGQFCVQESTVASPAPEPDAPPRPSRPVWGRRLGDRPYQRSARTRASVLPLWGALTVVVALTGLSRYDTDNRMQALADQVARSSQALVRLESAVASRVQRAGSPGGVLARMEPEAAAPKPAPAAAQELAEQRISQTGIPNAGQAASQPAPPPQPVATADTSAPDMIYVVREGDNLYRIGLRFNLSAQTLMAHNSLTRANVVFVGQRIRIPSGGNR